MAYPFFNPSYAIPYGQSFYPQNYQTVTQPQAQNQVPQNYSPAINQSGIIWISGESEAQMFPVSPNSAVALWAKDGKTIYLKQADATGRPSLTVYDLVERSQNVSDNSSDTSAKSIDYATKDDLGRIVGVVKSIDEVIASMKADIDGMKGDLYGAVGKRKPIKKEAVEDDA